MGWYILKAPSAGRLAERWEHSPDYQDWTYYARPGVRWYDGVPVTAHDVKFSLDLLTHPDILEISPGHIPVEHMEELWLDDRH